jgi:hypothetical protein
MRDPDPRANAPQLGAIGGGTTWARRREMVAVTGANGAPLCATRQTLLVEKFGRAGSVFPPDTAAAIASEAQRAA